jgi:Zn-dependent protease
VLYALGHPVALLGLVLGFVLAVVAHAWAQAFLASRLGDRRPRSEGRVTLDPRRQLDPFGCVAAALAGPGWPRPVEVGSGYFRGGSWKTLVSLAAGPVASGAIGLVLIVGARAAGLTSGAIGLDGITDLSDLLHGRGPADSVLPRFLVAAGAAALSVALVSLVPLPPLDAGRALFAVAPRSSGWQRARHWLIEQNVGLVAVLALLIIPISGERPLLLVLLDTVARPLLHALGSL